MPQKNFKTLWIRREEARRVRQEIQKQIWHEEQNYTKKPITEIEVMGVLAMLSD